MHVCEVSVCACMCVCSHMHAMVHMYKSESSTWELVLSFHQGVWILNLGYQASMASAFSAEPYCQPWVFHMEP